MTLSPSETNAAIDYNKRQGYCDHEIKLTQRTVGAVEDGIWGPETVNKVAVWQPTKGLTADGKVGPKTWEAVCNSWELVPVDPPPEKEVPTVGCGLAAYDQKFPGHTEEEALDVAFDTAIEEGCTEIRFWSSEWLISEELPNGGNKGNEYSGPWLTQKTIPEGVSVGAWVDDPVKNAMSEGFADRLVGMQVTNAALMLNKSNTRPSDTPWALRYTREQLEEIARVYGERGIKIIMTTWPRPSKPMIDAMCEDMAWIIEVTGSVVWEVDTEGNWDEDFLVGFSDMQAAADYLASRMRELMGPDGILELTTFTYHAENSKNAKLAPQMDRLLPQAYSVRHRNNETIDWGDSLGPGRHQTLAISRARVAANAG